MQFTSVKALDGENEKSVQEVENILIEKHEQELEGAKTEPIIKDEPIKETIELKEEDILSYIGKRYNKQINSVDELLREREETEAMPEDVASYLKYKKETGRGFEDFIKLKQDFDSMEPDTLIKEYLASTQEGLDEEDIDSLMDDYRFDEDLDDESHIKRVKISKKKAIAEAKKFFETQKEKYKMPLESSTAGLSKDEQEEFDSYKQYIKSAKTIQEENNRKSQWFSQKTEEVFDNGFKGFEFSINNKKMLFNPGEASELKKSHSTPQNFINKFLDENGMMKDAAGYHKSLAMAMNPDRFAKFFYEQGMADATEGTMKSIKNINMSERRVPESSEFKDGMQVKAINPDSGSKLKIRSVKRL
jgi:hypothetical protein